MKILLSAFACQAGQGSEPGLGWTWASRLARAGHDVWVITRSVGRDDNEAARIAHGLADRLHFVYYDHPRFPRSFGKTHLGYYVFCQSWQVGAFRVAKRLHARVEFDAVHHVTFATARFGSLMGTLGIPFTFGPVAGGERIPFALRRSLPVTGQLRELVRDLNNLTVAWAPLTRRTFAQADQILVTNAETLSLVPKAHRARSKIQLAIGTDAENDRRGEPIVRNDVVFELLHVGSLLSRKGLHLALTAFAQFHHEHPRSAFTIVGDGPERARLRSLARSLGIEDAIHWLPWQSRESVLELYRRFDVFLFPSLRDSGAMVVLEALANGLPVMCLDLGGPGTIVDETCGRVIATAGQGEAAVVAALVSRLHELANDPGLRERLRAGARVRARQFTWDSVIGSIYGDRSGT